MNHFLYPQHSHGGRNPAQDLLWSVSVRATLPRIAIVEALMEEKAPVSINVLCSILKKKAAKISQASVYRTLEMLVESGAVSRVNMGQMQNSYEILHGKKHHHHIICSECGDIEDIETCPARSMSDYLAQNSKKFGAVHSHSLEFFGRCKKCA